VQNLRFREASAYVKGILGVPARRALYEPAAEKNHQPVYLTIMAEFLKNPVIRAVKIDADHGHTGDVIAVAGARGPEPRDGACEAPAIGRHRGRGR